jgi:hypothetical protein
MLTLPPLVMLEILDWVAVPDGSSASALPLLNLALSCRGLFNLVNFWLREVRRADFEIFDSQSPDVCASLQPFSPLSRLCRRFGGICAYCNNRARHSLNGEIFTGLQLCHACEAFKFPKISEHGLRYTYIIANDSHHYLAGKHRQLTTLIDNARPFRSYLYKWSDIKELLETKRLLPRRASRHYFEKRFRADEFSYFASKIAWDTVLMGDKEFRESLLLSDCEHWAQDKELCASPLAYDIKLFMEFRYRFDSSWKPKQYREQVIEYIKTAWRWTGNLRWWKRPWKLCNFPQQPKCSITDPYATDADREQDLEDLRVYNEQCSRLRAIISAFPDILRAPDIWGKCTSPNWSKTKSIEFAKNSQQTISLEAMPEVLELGVHWTNDMILVRRARRHQLKDYFNKSVHLIIPVIRIEGRSLHIFKPDQTQHSFQF